MNGRDHQHPTGARRPGRRLILLALTLVLAGCGSGADTAISTGSPETGALAPTTTAGSGATTPGGAPAPPSSIGPGSGAGSGNAASQGNPSATTTPTADGPAVAVDLGGPLLFTPSLLLPSESFGEVAVGAASPPHRLQVRSPLKHPATIVALEPGGASFRISEDRCTGVTLPPAGSGTCTIAVTFSPSEAGQATGDIRIRMTHTCTSDTYIPCSWTPERIQTPGTAPNFTRVVLPSGQVRFDWTRPLILLAGKGIGSTA